MMYLNKDALAHFLNRRDNGKIVEVKSIIKLLLATLVLFLGCDSSNNSEVYNSSLSAARNWNDALLVAIRNDFARPTVHARNLFHSSAMMYDLWAVYDTTADFYFLGQSRNGVECAFTSSQRSFFQRQSANFESSRNLAISYAMYTLFNESI